MTHVSVYYKMLVASGHHRQPRNSNMSIDLADPSFFDIVPGGPCNPPYFPQLPYPPPSGTNIAKMVFWSVTDGASGQVVAPGTLNWTVGTTSLTITAWYFPTGDGHGPPLIIDDAFSANLGQFIDDTFVDVTSDPSLTGDANVVGIVPTSSPETLVAHMSVLSTPEPFHVWVLNGVFSPVGQTALNVPQGTVGVAVAIYQDSGRVHKIPGQYVAYNPWWWIESWWGHGPDPGPEGVRDFAIATELADAASRAAPQLRAQIMEAALAQAKLGVAAIVKSVKASKAK